MDENKILEELRKQLNNGGINEKSGIDFKRLMIVLREVKKQEDGE